jgi:hypothetical protein
MQGADDDQLVQHGDRIAARFGCRPETAAENELPLRDLC